MKSKLILLPLILFVSLVSNASNYYWVGGSGNWSDYANHWATSSGGAVFHAQVPTPADDVFFDANSFTSSGQTVMIDQTIVQCHSMSWTGVINNPTLTLPATNSLRIFGSLTFVPLMNTNIMGNVSFEATSTGNTITSAGKILNVVFFDGVAGSWTLLDAMTATNDQYASAIYLNTGTLTTNNQTLSTVQFYITGNASTLNLGASVCNTTFGWFADQMQTGSVVNAGTSTINITGLYNNTAYFYGGPNQTYHNLNFTSPTNFGALRTDNSPANTFTGNVTFFGDGGTFSNGSITFNDLTLTPGHTFAFSTTATHLINGSLNATGNCGALISIKSNIAGVPATIQKTSGSVLLSYITLKDIAATGGAIFTANNSIDLGNNTGWTNISLPVPKNLYWIGNAGNWSDGNHWSMTSGGPASGCAPAPVDNAFFDANSFTLPGQVVAVDLSNAFAKNMSWTGVINNPTLTLPATNSLRIFGSLTFVPLMNTNIMGNVSFEATSTGNTITSAGKILNVVFFDGVAGSWTLLDAMTATNDQYASAIYLNTGTLTTNNQTLSTVQFYITGNASTLNLGASVCNTTFGWFADQMQTGSVVNAGTSTINITGLYNNTAYFYGGPNQTYHNLNFTSPTNFGALRTDNSPANTFTGNVTFFGDGGTFSNGSITFNDLTLTPGHTFAFSTTATHLINGSLNATGNCGALISIKSNIAGVPATIQKTSGSVLLSYITLKDIAATGGAIFTANNSIDLGNNTGWTNISLPVPKNLYWIGNAGNWSDGNHWSMTSGGPASGCAPAPVDNAFFDANSFTLPGQVVAVDLSNAFAKNMSWTGVINNPTLTLPATNSLRIFGSLTFVPLMNTNIMGNVSFEATSTGNTITSAGKILNVVFFDGVAGSWTLLDAMTATNDQYASAIYLNTGTLTTNNQTLSTVQFYITGNASTLNLGASVCNTTFGWFADQIQTGSVVNAGTSTINITGLYNNTAYFYGGPNQTYHNLNFTSPTNFGALRTDNSPANTFTGNVTFFGDGGTFSNGSITFNDLTLTPGHTFAFSTTATHLINGSLNATGNPAFPIRIQSSNAGSPATISKPSGSVCLDYVRISDITATGGAFFNAGLSPTRSLDMGGNSGWVFTGASTTFYRDADGDSFGNPAITTLACSPPAGYVTNNTDCNDANAAVHPGAIEICNGIDDNCDGQIDEGVKTIFYRDADGDGYGNPAITTLACSPPAGYVTNNTDCNDNNAAVHPGATEILNGIDDNCNGQIDEGLCNLSILGNLAKYHLVFTNGSLDANWQGASKGFIGDVALNGILAAERTSGTAPYAGKIYTNDNTLSAWQNIVNANSSQASRFLNETARLTGLNNDLEYAFSQINAMVVTPGYDNRSAVSLNNVNTLNGIPQTIVINITSGFQVSSKINITGDANDLFILRWDTDKNFSNGYNGQVKFQSGGAIVPLGGLTAANFIHAAGDINASGGGTNPPAPYPQGPRNNNGTGSLITGGSNFSGGGFFTGYWLTTGTPTIFSAGQQPYGQTADLSNAIFVGGWYSKTTKFSMTGGTSGVYVAGCIAPPPPDISICAGPTRTIYTGATSGVGPFGPQSVNLTSSVSGGTPGYTYSWSPATGLSNAAIANPIASPATTTTYTLTVTDSYGSSRSLGITINVLPLSAAVCSGNGNNIKFNVCHIPPGNPTNANNICVSVNALPAHLTSGSNGHNNCYLGPCQENCVSTIQENARGINYVSTPGPVNHVAVGERTPVKVNEEFSVNVYPNPSTGEFSLQVISNRDEPVTVRVLDVNGLVRSVSLMNSKINTIKLGSHLTEGTYMAEVTQGTNRKVVKLIRLK